MPNPMQSLEGPGVGEEEFDLSKMSEEELQQLVQLGVIDENMAENSRQMKLAEQLRYGTPSPQGIQAGNVYVASNPLEHIGRGMEQWTAQKRMKDLEKQRGEMQGQQTAGRQTYWDLLRGRRRKPQDFSGIEMPQVDLGEY